MTTAPPKPRPVAFTNPRQERVHRLLGSIVGEGAQALYRDGVRLLAAPNLESTSHLLGHIAREIESSVRAVLLPIADRSDVDRAPAARDTTSSGSGDRHTAEVRRIVNALGLPEDDGVGAVWIRLSRRGFAAHAHRRSLERPRPFDNRTAEMWGDLETIVGGSLARCELRFLDFKDAVDRLISKPIPNAKDIRTLKEHLPNSPVLRQYFFGTLQHSGWLDPLNAAGFFNEAPPVAVDEEGGRRSVPYWPQIDYLKRMSLDAERHASLHQIVNSLAPTDNELVQTGLCELLVALPTNLSADCVDRVVDWLKAPAALSQLPEQAARFACRLVAGGFEEGALRIVAALLSSRHALSEADTGRNSHFGYQFGEALKAIIEGWPSTSRLSLLRVLCAGLRADLETADVSRGYALTHSRPSIQSAHPWRRYDISEQLIDAIRDTSLALVEEPKNTAATLAALQESPHELFRRIADYVVAHMIEAPADLDQRVLNRGAFDRWRREPEYVAMLTRWFGAASEQTRNELLRWIEAGPDLSADDRDELRRQATKERWQLVRLESIANYLPEEWVQRLADLRKSWPRQDSEVDSGAVWVGPTSPHSADELAALSTEDLASFLGRWVPKSGWREPSRGGVGRILTQVVESNPAPYASSAATFRGLHPAYVCALFEGWVNALKRSVDLEWEPVITLCEWAVDQTDQPDEPAEEDGDLSWEWTHGMVVRLLRAAFVAKPQVIPIEFRDRVWALIQRVVASDDPSPAREAGKSAKDAFGIAINSVRGDAMLAAVGYALWVKHHLTGTPSEVDLRRIPEVVNCWDAALDPSVEPSPAVRSVFGAELGAIAWLDPAWLSGHVDAIFPSDPRHGDLWAAAWVTYLLFSQLHPELWPILRPQYRRSVGELPTDSEGGHDDAETHLGMHLVAHACWRNEPEANELLREFFRRASIPLQRTVLNIVGQQLGHADDPLPPNVRDRFQELWEWYDRETEQLADSGRDAFGWWFASNKFDSRWAGNIALKLLDGGIPLEPDSAIVEAVQPLIAGEPVMAAQIFRGVIDTLQNQWTLLGWRSKAKQVLRLLLQSPSTEAKEIAVETINKLAALGHLEFQALVTEPIKSDDAE